MSGTVTLTRARPGCGESIRSRVVIYAGLMLGLEVIGFIWFVAGTHGWISPLTHPVSTDFVSFYAAGRLAGSGTPALAYDQAAHHAAEEAATSLGVAYNFFLYPPVFLLLCVIIARLPYLLAYVTFQGVTLVPCVLLARCILRSDNRDVFVPLLAFPAVFFTLGTGQNAFLSAALFAAATMLIDPRPIAAGVLFGALCYKPHFGILVPFALIASRQWRAFAAATVAAAALVAVSLLVFGWETWHAYFVAIAGADTIYRTGVTLAGMASPFGATLVLGGGQVMAYVVQATATLAMIVTVSVVWRREPSLPIRAAVLLAATPLAIPVVMFYDLMLCGIALAWLVRWGCERDFPAWLGFAVSVLFVATLLSGNFDPQARTLIPPLIAITTFAVSIVAAFSERAATMQAPA